MKEEKGLTIPKTIAELVSDEKDWIQRDLLNGMLNKQPPKEWIQEHPIYKGVKFLPIDKVEYLLKRFFQQYKIEVLREGHLFNSVYCAVRVHYIDPLTKEWTYQDGVGAQDVQTKSGSSPANMADINHGAIARGLPAAKSYAIKDACENIGIIFGSNLNRKDTMAFNLEKNTVDAYTPEQSKKYIKEIKDNLELVFDEESLNKYFKQLNENKLLTPEIRTLFSQKLTEINQQTNGINTGK